MPFDSDKQRRYMFAKHPKIAKKMAHKAKDGGIMTEEEKIKQSRMKKGVPGYKARRFMHKLFGGDDTEAAEPKKKEKKKSRFHLIESMMKKSKK